MKTLLSSVVFALAAASTTASANNYINFKNNDVTNFADQAGHRVSVKVTQNGNAGWQKYSEFLGSGERWVWAQGSDDSVFVYNETRQVAEKIVNFGDAIGQRYSFNLGNCMTAGVLEQKGLTLTTPAGNFKDVVRMSFSGMCADKGTIEAWFAPKVGVIKWSAQSFAGPNNFELVDGTIGGKSVKVNANQNPLQISANFPRNYFLLGATTEQVSASIDLTNTSTQNVVLHFSSGQEFDLSLIDSNNQVVNIWSANKRFIQAFHDVTIAPGQTRSFGAALDLRNVNGQALAAGVYTLRFEVKGSQITGLPGARAETSILIQRSN